MNHEGAKYTKEEEGRKKKKERRRRKISPLFPVPYY
jgi:hypothetical protein